MKVASLFGCIALCLAFASVTADAADFLDTEFIVKSDTANCIKKCQKSGYTAEKCSTYVNECQQKGYKAQGRCADLANNIYWCQGDPCCESKLVMVNPETDSYKRVCRPLDVPDFQGCN